MDDFLVFYASCIAMLLGVGAFIVTQLIVYTIKCRDDGKTFADKFARGGAAVRFKGFAGMAGIAGESDADDARKRARKDAADANYRQCQRDKQRRQQSCVTAPAARRPSGRPAHGKPSQLHDTAATCANLRAFLLKK